MLHLERAKVLWAHLRANHFPSFNLSHSQFGEDMVLRYLTQDKKTGFYVDVGAHHPFYYSNTFHFYSKGWRGLNIDAIPGSMRAFKRLRPKDINVESCVGTKTGDVEFFIFNAPALNTTDAKLARIIQDEERAKLLRKERVHVLPLAQILEEHLPKGQKIDFLSIDVEGSDEDVLKSNDWNKFVPNHVVVECHGLNINNLNAAGSIQFLTQRGYTPNAVCGPSVILSHSSCKS
jgi:FkbM family methyltransferase